MVCSSMRIEVGVIAHRDSVANYLDNRKGVFGNQLKTVCGRVMSGVNETLSGEPIDAIFGYLSVSDRIVRSPEIMGTTNKLMELITKRAIEAYRKGT